MSSLLVGLARLVGALLVFAGAFFFVAATVGVIRMPDPYNRGHVAGKGDSPGFILCLLGIWFYWLTISPSQSLKILLIIVFMLFVNPLAIHFILRLCFRQGVDYCKGTTVEEEK